MTARQEQVLAAIRAFIGAEGRPPTLREIGGRLNLGPSTVHYHVAVLRRLGAIRVERGKRRGIVVVGGPCPYCGQERAA